MSFVVFSVCELPLRSTPLSRRHIASLDFHQREFVDHHIAFSNILFSLSQEHQRSQWKLLDLLGNIDYFPHRIFCTRNSLLHPRSYIWNYRLNERTRDSINDTSMRFCAETVPAGVILDKNRAMRSLYNRPRRYHGISHCHTIHVSQSISVFLNRIQGQNTRETYLKYNKGANFNDELIPHVSWSLPIFSSFFLSFSQQ